MSSILMTTNKRRVAGSKPAGCIFFSMHLHHTKNKGDIGVLKTCVDLAEQGYLILTPLSEHSPFDIVAYKDKKFLRIQVKYRTLKNGALQIRLWILSRCCLLHLKA